MPIKKREAFFAGLLIAIAAVLFALGFNSPVNAANFPDPIQDESKAPQASNTQETVVIAGGCFWGMQAVFQHVKGVTQTVAGYAGGEAETAAYEKVSTGETGHAESLQVTYDPSQITLGEILKIYFSVAHDPTELNHQGADHGTQYRSAIFYANDEQQKIATAYIAQLDQAKLFSDPIVTKLEPLSSFYPAEAYHQNYAKLHPSDTYIIAVDDPKIAALRKSFPDFYVN